MTAQKFMLTQVMSHLSCRLPTQPVLAIESWRYNDWT